MNLQTATRLTANVLPLMCFLAFKYGRESKKKDSKSGANKWCMWAACWADLRDTIAMGHTAKTHTYAYKEIIQPVVTQGHLASHPENICHGPEAHS